MIGRLFSYVLLLGCCSSGFAADQSSLPQAQQGRTLITENVILVTLDGVRTQEIFSGLDEIIAVHDQQQVYSEIELARQRYAGASAAERRALLMPVFWNRLAPQGIVLGNANYDNHVRVQNQMLWSTPGYTEMMTGQPQPEVTDNDNLRHSPMTALELASTRLGANGQQVVQFGSWDGFKYAAASRDDAFLMMGAYDSVPARLSTPAMDQLAVLRREVMGLWEEGSNDALTLRLAQAYVQAWQPRVLWLALVNSDDWAHADRYDRYLEYLHQTDALLGQLWDSLQALDQYRGKTTLIITTDHGRGLQGSDWAEHELAIPGSADIWMAIIGPDTPDRGEVTEPGTVYQGQVAATLLQFLGIDYRELASGALPPVTSAFPPL